MKVSGYAIVIKQSKNKQWFFTITASNGHKIATSETYTRKSDAKKAARKLRAAFYDKMVFVGVINAR